MKLPIGMEQRVADALGAEGGHIDLESGAKALALLLAEHHYANFGSGIPLKAGRLVFRDQSEN